MKNIFFSSDQHIFHQNIIKYCNRPFKTVQEMYDVLVQNHNKLVKDKDDVYFLGDFAWRLSDDAVERALNAFNGHKFFVIGNHDDRKQINKMVERRAISRMYDVCWLDHVGKCGIWLSHYPHLSWPKSSHGSWMLHGHTHQNLPDDRNALRLDIGVDGFGFCPVSLEEVEIKMSTKSVKTQQY